jgi:hypothetical protein
MESVDSLRRVEESSVTREDALGEPERVLGALAAAYARSRSALERCNVRRLRSVPLVVNVGFVVGAEILEVTEVLLTVTGGPGRTLSYGTERRS